MAVEELRRSVEKHKPLGNLQEELAPRFTGAFQSLLTKAITDIESGKLRIDNFTELQRVYMMWKEVVEYKDVMEGQANAQGVIPALNTRTARIYEVAGIEEDTAHLEELGEEEMTNVIMGMLQASNQTNVDQMKGLDSE